jgi:hypothetical protein
VTPADEPPRTPADRIIAALDDLVRRWDAGEPIPVTVVRREQTPDGPLHTFRRRVLRRRKKGGAP